MAERGETAEDVIRLSARAAIGCAAALAAGLFLVAWMEVDPSDWPFITFVAAAPLLLLHTAIVVFFPGMRLRVVVAGAAGGSVIYLMLSIAALQDPFGLFTLPFIAVLAAGPWAAAAGIDHALWRRRRARSGLGLCVDCAYDCEGLERCPECGRVV